MKKTSAQELAKKLKIPNSRGLEAVIKAKLLTAILKTIELSGTTHAEIAKVSGVPRSSVTGILSGSLQKVSLERLLRLAEALELTAKITVKKAA